MYLPFAENAQVDRRKIVEYLLCAEHPDGRSKAEFFSMLGFEVRNWHVFAEALKLQARQNVVGNIVESPFGIRYAVDGDIETPRRSKVSIRTVWIIENDSTRPRLITAHPL